MLINSRLLGTALLLGNLTLLSLLTNAFASDDFAASIAKIVHAAVNEEGDKTAKGESEATVEAKHQTEQFAKDQVDNDTDANKTDSKTDNKTDDKLDDKANDKTDDNSTNTEAEKAEKTEKTDEQSNISNAPAAPEGASVRIISPTDGEEVSSPVKVVFGLTNMGVAPAGVDRENTGHHHIIIDGGDELPKAGVPMTDNVKHFGGGQTETALKLDKGEHTLQLIMGDKNHIPHNPPIVSKKITITVK